MPKKGKSAALEEFELFCESKGLNGLRNGRKVWRKQNESWSRDSCRDACQSPLSLSPGDCHCACFFLLHARDQQGTLLEQCVFLFPCIRAMAHNRHLPSPLSRRCRVANRLSPCMGVVPNRDSADRHEASRRVRQGAKRQSHLRILQPL